jgi:proteasome lid subunit RPN8/RPN11
VFPLLSASANAPGSGAGRFFDLPRRLLEELVRQARQSLPEECCGILLGAEGVSGCVRAHRAVPVENVSTRCRKREYLVAPLEILRAHRQARREGLEIVGYYHSHPSGSAFPSVNDCQKAWPDTSYVILGVSGGEVADIRSWRLGAGDVGLIEEELNFDQDQK